MKIARLLLAALGVLAAASASAQMLTPSPLPFPPPRIYVVPDTTPVEYFGAIAYQRESGAFADRGATRAEAETKALDACGDASCIVKAWSCTR